MSFADPARFRPADFGRPYWAEAIPGPPPPADPARLPASADVVVVGAGYTGLNAALAAARAGLDVVVIDRDYPGAGASGRNGGHVSSSMKPEEAELARHVGAERAREVLSLGPAAQAYLNRLIAEERIDCDLETPGHFMGAHKPGAVAGLKAWAEGQRALGTPVQWVERADQRAIVGSDHFHGGVLMPSWQSLHPGKYVAGLAARVEAAGVRIFPGVALLSVARGRERVELSLVGGRRITARHAILGMNAHVGSAAPDLRRQVIPIASVQVSTVPLDPGLVRRLHPRRAMVYDSRRLVTYSRVSPDGTRILVGSRVPFTFGQPQRSRAAMQARMARVFPELSETPTGHIWGGLVAYTPDHLPHIGSDDGLHHAMGYCGTGVAMASYLGHLLGRRAAGEEATTALDEVAGAGLKLYNGRPWFLPAVMAWYGFEDRFR
jgi:glycine/D-amino acid oxidase-like deaminating enzyme